MADSDLQPFLDLARDAYSESTDYFNSGIRREIEADIRQFQGLHPHGSKYLHESYRARSRFFRPKTRAAVRKHEAVAAQALFSNSDVITCSPEDATNPAQVQGAAVWNEVLNYRLTKTIGWFQLSVGGYQDAMNTGVVVSYQNWLYDERRKIDRPGVDLRPLENIRFSPTAKWNDPVGSSPYFIDLLPMLCKDVISRMRVPDPKTGQPRWMMTDAPTLLQAAQSYSDSITLQRDQGRADRNAVSRITDFTPVWVHRNFIEVDGVDYVYYTLGTLHMLTQPRPVELVYPLDGQRPYVMGNCVIETHKTYPAGPVRLARDIQAELNENANQRSDNVKFAMNKRYFVKRGRQVDLRSLQRNVPSSSTLMEDPETDVKIVDTPDVTRSAYEEQDRLNLDFDEVVGNFSQSSVGSNRRLSETKGGMELLTEDADQLGAYQLRTFAETWVKPVLRQVLKFEMAYETDEKIFLLAGKRAAAKSKLGERVVIDEALLRHEVAINIDIGIGATSPQTRLTNLIFGLVKFREMLGDGVLQQVGADPHEIAEEIFTKLGYDGAERFFPNKGDDPRLEQLQQALDDANAKLARREDPELTKAKVAKLYAEVDKIGASKLKEVVEAIFGSMQAAEVVVAVPQITPVADQLMRAGGYQPPSPPGVDPGFAPGEQGPGAQVIGPPGDISVQPVVNKRTGVGFTPGSNVDAIPGGPPGTATHPANTNPLTPVKPASPFVGANHGIETMREDSIGDHQ